MITRVYRCKIIKHWYSMNQTQISWTLSSAWLKKMFQNTYTTVSFTTDRMRASMKLLVAQLSMKDASSEQSRSSLNRYFRLQRTLFKLTPDKYFLYKHNNRGASTVKTLLESLNWITHIVNWERPASTHSSSFPLLIQSLIIFITSFNVFEDRQS